MHNRGLIVPAQCVFESAHGFGSWSVSSLSSRVADKLEPEDHSEFPEKPNVVWTSKLRRTARNRDGFPSRSSTWTDISVPATACPSSVPACASLRLRASPPHHAFSFISRRSAFLGDTAKVVERSVALRLQFCRCVYTVSPAGTSSLNCRLDTGSMSPLTPVSSADHMIGDTWAKRGI